VRADRIEAGPESAPEGGPSLLPRYDADVPDENGEPQPRRIPEATVLRLPVYQRILTELLRGGQSTVSSEQLAALAQMGAAKVRKDLSLLGSFGTRGTGYDAAFLVAQIDRALGVDRHWPVSVVGIGNLGRALINSKGFFSRGFRVTSLFDVHPDVVGQDVGGLIVRHLDELGALEPLERPVIGVVATPASAAQEASEALVRAGVRSVLNFAPRVLELPSDVFVRYVDLSIELQVISFYESRRLDTELAGPPFLRSVGLSLTPEPA
jgi:redox-sensing transcriptional repressor